MILFDLRIFLENGLVQPPTRIFLQGNSRKVVIVTKRILVHEWIYLMPSCWGDVIKFATSLHIVFRPCLFLCFPKNWHPFTLRTSFKNQAVNGVSWSFPHFQGKMPMNFQDVPKKLHGHCQPKVAQKLLGHVCFQRIA